MDECRVKVLTALRESGRVMEVLSAQAVSWADYQAWRADDAFARAADEAIRLGRLALAERLEARAEESVLSGRGDARLLLTLLKAICPERYGDGAKGGEAANRVVYVHDWPQLDQ